MLDTHTNSNHRGIVAALLRNGSDRLQFKWQAHHSCPWNDHPPSAFDNPRIASKILATPFEVAPFWRIK
jgi:hypothetical protein